MSHAHGFHVNDEQYTSRRVFCCCLGGVGVLYTVNRRILAVR